ncbi:MAG: Lrp/AsnC family transcriptional regulator [Sphingomonadales bacterium]
MDRTDRQILHILQQDGRSTNLALAERVNLSPTPCLKRVRRLEDSGVIRGYAAQVDAQAAGMQVCAMVLIKISANTREAADGFAEAIARIDAVTECHTVAGRYDYLCKLYARDVAEFERILRDQLSRLPALADIETLFVLSTLIDPRGLAL